MRSEPRYTTTNENGEFFFADVEPGIHTISAVQSGAVLASVEVNVRRAHQTGEVNAIKLSDNSILVQVSLDLAQIYIQLSIADETLNLVSVVNEPASPGTPDTPPDTPGTSVTLDAPGTPGTPDIPDIPEDIPGTPDIPDTPSTPDTPGTPDTPPGTGRPSSPSVPNRAPDFIAGDDYPVGQEWSVATQVDIFAPRAGNTGVNIIGGDTVISPGATGKYAFRLRNPERYAVEYLIKLEETDQNSPKLPLRYRLKKGLVGSDDYIGGYDWKEARDILTPTTSLMANSSAYYTLEWKWVTISNSIDTAIGTQLHYPGYVLNIIVNASFK